MNIEGPKVSVEKSATYLFQALTDVKSFERLMPENIAKFEVTDENSFVFGLSGMPEIKLQLKEKIASSKVVLGAASDKLPFSLTANIDQIGEEKSDIQLFFSGEFNPMMAMMIKGPITKFLETLSLNMDKL